MSLDPTDTPKPEGPDFARAVELARPHSAFAGRGMGCMAGGGIGVAASILFGFFAMDSSSRRGASLFSILVVLAAGALLFRGFKREDPAAVAVGLLMGLAFAGLLVGMCGSL